jgi:hypothetical protein
MSDSKNFQRRFDELTIQIDPATNTRRTHIVLTELMETNLTILASDMGIPVQPSMQALIQSIKGRLATLSETPKEAVGGETVEDIQFEYDQIENAHKHRRLTRQQKQRLYDIADSVDTGRNHRNMRVGKVLIIVRDSIFPSDDEGDDQDQDYDDYDDGQRRTRRGGDDQQDNYDDGRTRVRREGDDRGVSYASQPQSVIEPLPDLRKAPFKLFPVHRQAGYSIPDYFERVRYYIDQQIHKGHSVTGIYTYLEDDGWNTNIIHSKASVAYPPRHTVHIVSWSSSYRDSYENVGDKAEMMANAIPSNADLIGILQITERSVSHVGVVYTTNK